MSLSPDDFRNSIGGAGIEEASVLLYPTEIVGVSPCGCDGWPLKLDFKEKVVLCDFSFENERRIFPPPRDFFPETRTQEEKIKEQLKRSKQLYQEIVQFYAEWYKTHQ